MTAHPPQESPAQTFTPLSTQEALVSENTAAKPATQKTVVESDPGRGVTSPGKQAQTPTVVKAWTEGKQAKTGSIQHIKPLKYSEYHGLKKKKKKN